MQDAFPTPDASYGWGPSASVLDSKYPLAYASAGDEMDVDESHSAPSAASRLRSLSAWLEATGSRSAQLVPADMLRLSAESVARAEAELAAVAAKQVEDYSAAAGSAAAAAKTAGGTKATADAVAALVGGGSERGDIIVELPAASLLTPAEPLISLGGLTAHHVPGEYVIYIRGAGPVPFGERGIVLATQGAR
eukprot:scaffold3945_cov105-Isochrysis_galbana.AAC.20